MEARIMHPEILLIALLLIAHPSPSVTVAVDRGWYSPGDQVTIHIFTNASTFQNGTWLWLYIDKPDGRNAFFAQLTAINQTVVWIIPPDAPDGTYTVTVTWDHRYTQTGFTVQAQPVPEFSPFTTVVMLFAAAVATIAILRWKASASIAAPTAHPGPHMLC